MSTKRDLIATYLKENPDKGPKEVAEALDTKLMPISPNYVSLVKCQMKKTRKTKTRLAKPQHLALCTVENGNGVPKPDLGLIDIIMQTRSLAKRLGSYSELRRLVEALEA